MILMASSCLLFPAGGSRPARSPPGHRPRTPVYSILTAERNGPVRGGAGTPARVDSAPPAQDPGADRQRPLHVRRLDAEVGHEPDPVTAGPAQDPQPAAGLDEDGRGHGPEPEADDVGLDAFQVDLDPGQLEIG